MSQSPHHQPYPLVIQLHKITQILLLILLTSLSTHAQLHLKGTIIQEGPKLIPYANIGVPAKHKGTITDPNGEFSLLLPASCLNDTVQLSCPGYFPRSIPVKDMAQNKTSIYILYAKENNEPVVSRFSSQPKINISGIKPEKPDKWLPLSSNTPKDIIELVQLVKMQATEGTILSIHIMLRPQLVDTATFRINLYHAQNGQPGQRITERSLITRQPIKQGWINIDLNDQDIILSEDFFIGLEYLPEKAVNGAPFAVGSKKGGSTLIKKGSQEQWVRQEGITPAIYVSISY